MADELVNQEGDRRQRKEVGPMTDTEAELFEQIIGDPDDASQEHTALPKTRAEALVRGAVLYRLLSDAAPADPIVWDDPDKAIQPPISSYRDEEK